MYITVETLAKSFQYSTLVQLSNDEHVAAEINEAVLEQAIQYASERIDAALRSRYRLPLEEVPTVIRHYCLNLARYWLYARRPESKLPDTVKEVYHQAIKELEQVANGKLHLGIAQGSRPSTSPTPVLETPQGEPAQAEPPQRSPYGDLLPDVGEYQVKAATRIDTTGY